MLTTSLAMHPALRPVYTSSASSPADSTARAVWRRCA